MLPEGLIKKFTMLIAILGTSIIANAQENYQKPNIVFILADDFGYGSINSYGADKNLLRTPNIDRIAEEGMRFTNASTPASICTPTRYGFLTGRYPWRTGLKYGVTHIFSELLPDTERITIADWLKERGYHTAAVGKWHLGYGQLDDETNSNIQTRVVEPVEYTKKVSPGPLDLGFDYHFGVPQNHDDALGVYIENDRIYGIRSNKIHAYSRSFYGQRYIGFDAPQRVNEDVMEVLTEKSVDWLKKQTKDDPFFLYFAAVAVHHPSTPSGYMRGMSDCGPYGDFIQDLDLSVGRIVETLEYMNLLENTIIIFSSDNGGDNHTIYQGGTNVPFIVSWPGIVKEGSVSDDKINLLDIFATVCDITDGKLPESKEVAPDSYSFLPVLLNETNPHPRTSMVTADANGMHALRDGDWKFIDDTPPDGLPDNRLKQLEGFEPQLYDLVNDPGETINLYKKNPDMAKRLLEELKSIREAKFTR